MRSKIPYDIGINKNIVAVLKEAISKLDPLDRYCVLLFDELALQPALVYKEKSDSIEGFEDISLTRSLKFADYSFVFMIKGLGKH